MEKSKTKQETNDSTPTLVLFSSSVARLLLVHLGSGRIRGIWRAYREVGRWDQRSQTKSWLRRKKEGGQQGMAGAVGPRGQKCRLMVFPQITVEALLFSNCSQLPAHISLAVFDEKYREESVQTGAFNSSMDSMGSTQEENENNAMQGGCNPSSSYFTLFFSSFLFLPHGLPQRQLRQAPSCCISTPLCLFA